MRWRWVTSGASRPRRRIFPSGHANEGPRRGPGGGRGGAGWGTSSCNLGLKGFLNRLVGVEKGW